MTSRTTSRTDNPAVAAIPSRELRLLVDGIRNWVRSIASPNGAPSLVGVLQGTHHGTASLLAALETVVGDLGIRFLSTSFVPSGHLCGEPIADLLEPVVRCALAESGESESNGERQSTILGTLGPDLRVVFPELPWPNDVTPAGVGHPEDDRWRRIDALVRALIDHVDDQPTVVALHGVDECDSFSCEFLRQLLRALRRTRSQRRARVLVLLTGNEGHLPQIPELDRPRRTAFRVEARGYSREELQDLARRHLGEEFSVSRREKLFRVVAGDTRFVHRLFRRFRDDEIGSTLVLESCPSFADLVREDHATLDPSTRQVVSLLAVVGFPVDTAFISAWIENHGIVVDTSNRVEDLDTLLESLRDDEWIRSCADVKGARWYVEPDVAEAVLAGETEERVERVLSESAHLILDRCETLGRGTLRAFRLLTNPKLELSEAASRRVSGEDLEDVLGGATRPLFGDWSVPSTGDVVGQYLESIGGASEALEVLEETLGSLDESDDELAEELQDRVVRLLESTGNFREAIELLQARGREESRPDVLATISRRTGELLGKLGDPAGRLRCYEESARWLESAEAEAERSRSFGALGRHWLEERDLEAARGHAEKALSLLESRESYDETERRGLLRLLETISAQAGDYPAALGFEQAVYESSVHAANEPEQIESLVRLSELFSQLGDRVRVESCLTRALELAEKGGARRVEANVARLLGRALGDRREYDEAFRQLERAWTILDEFDDGPGLARIEASLVDCELRTGRFRRAARTLLHCIERRFGCACAWPLRADGSTDGGGIAVVEQQRRVERARQQNLESKLERSRDTLTCAEVLELVDLWRRAGKVDEAFRLLEFAVGSEAFKSNPEARARAVQELGRFALLRGDVELALKSFEQSLKPRGSLPSPDCIGTTYLEVGGVLLLRGHFDRALDYTVRGLRRAWDHGDPGAIIDSLLALSRFFLEVGEFRAASVVTAGAANLARMQGLWEQELDACALAARATRGAGKERATRRALSRAWELDAVVDAPLARCRLLLEAGWDRYHCRDFAKACEHGRAGIALLQQTASPVIASELWHLVGAVQGSLHNPHNNLLEALDVLERVQREAERRGCPRLAWDACAVLEEIYSSRGKDETAASVRQRADEAWTVCHAALPDELRGLAWSPRHRPGFSQNLA